MIIASVLKIARPHKTFFHIFLTYSKATVIYKRNDVSAAGRIAGGQSLILFREGVLRLVPGKPFRESGRLMQLAGLQGIEVFVGLQLAFGNL